MSGKWDGLVHAAPFVCLSADIKDLWELKSFPSQSISRSLTGLFQSLNYVNCRLYDVIVINDYRPLVSCGTSGLVNKENAFASPWPMSHK